MIQMISAALKYNLLDGIITLNLLTECASKYLGPNNIGYSPRCYYYLKQSKFFAN